MILETAIYVPGEQIKVGVHTYILVLGASFSKIWNKTPSKRES